MTSQHSPLHQVCSRRCSSISSSADIVQQALDDFVVPSVAAVLEEEQWHLLPCATFLSAVLEMTVRSFPTSYARTAHCRLRRRGCPAGMFQDLDPSRARQRGRITLYCPADSFDRRKLDEVRGTSLFLCSRSIETMPTTGTYILQQATCCLVLSLVVLYCTAVPPDVRCCCHAAAGLLCRCCVPASLQVPSSPTQTSSM